MAEVRMGEFIVDREARTVRIDGTQQFLVNKDKFGDRALLATSLFIRAFEYGQKDFSRKLAELTKL